MPYLAEFIRLLTPLTILLEINRMRITSWAESCEHHHT